MTVELIPWTTDDVGLVARAHGNLEMMRYLGGVQTPQQIEEQHQRYIKAAELDKGRAFKIVPLESSEAAGGICFWEVSEGSETFFEMGWNIFPEFQRRGLATAAAAKVIELLKMQRRLSAVQAVPAIENEASNAICKRLSFDFLETREIEYPKGHFMMANVWRLTL